MLPVSILADRKSPPVQMRLAHCADLQAQLRDLAEAAGRVPPYSLPSSAETISTYLSRSFNIFQHVQHALGTDPQL